MFNVKVFKIKDLIVYFLGFTIIIGIIYFIVKRVPIKQENDNNQNEGAFFQYDLTGCIDTASTVIKNINNKEEKSIKALNKNLYEDILKGQISLVEEIENEEGYIENENNIGEEVFDNNNTNQENNNIENQLVKTNLSTEVITENPIALNFNKEFNSVKIKNQTSYELTNELLEPSINIDNKRILLFHTHTCESYTSSEAYSYNATGNFRTTDLNFTVARLGDELERGLHQYGYDVIHDKTYHDYPSYNGSYTRSLETVQKIIKDNPTDIIFDIHRDAIGSRSDYAPCVKIGEDIAAQIMFVIGTNEGGLWHPNWNQNLKFAIKVQQKAEELYPGLFKPITLTKYRYNQHIGKYANIIEVGATGNTLEQCLNSMKYLSKVLSEVI